MKQLKLNRVDFKVSKPFGGELMKKTAGRGARPISTSRSMHLVMRSTQAIGNWSFRTPKNSKLIDLILKFTAKKYGVKIYSFANSGNHLHLVIRLGNRHTYRAFIRSLTGTIALKITGSNRLNRLKKKFWDCRPFTRIIEWGKAYVTAKSYVRLNQLESDGVIAYQTGPLKNLSLLPSD